MPPHILTMVLALVAALLATRELVMGADAFSFWTWTAAAICVVLTVPLFLYESRKAARVICYRCGQKINPTDAVSFTEGGGFRDGTTGTRYMHKKNCPYDAPPGGSS